MNAARDVVVMPAENPAMKMIQNAVAQGWEPGRIQQLMDLRDREEAHNARKAYVSAMANFKAEPTEILKTKHVNIPGGAKFMHATLANVCDGVVANLSKYGLSHRWELVQLDNGWIEVTCVLTHQDGHSERTTLRAPPDDSGKKNSIQQIASTVHYLERYTLLAATGLSAKDVDNDGRGATPARETPAAPEGYENWKGDMNAVAEEGKARHIEVWKGSKQEFRNYASTHDVDWFEGNKRKAAKVEA